MKIESTSVFALLVVAIPIGAQSPERVRWDSVSVPITIEVTQDVPIRTIGAVRGVLSARGDAVIPKGDRFQMLEIGLEGGCTIRYSGTQYEVSSCPWVPGFLDSQSDIYVIVEVPENRE